MNNFSTEKRAQVIALPVEGNSNRGTSRMAGVAPNTVDKLLSVLGAAYSADHDKAFRNLSCTRLQCDEIWSLPDSSELPSHAPNGGWRSRSRLIDRGGNRPIRIILDHHPECDYTYVATLSGSLGLKPSTADSPAFLILQPSVLQPKSPRPSR